ncbi:dynein assembly factor 1, axonemal homolog [Anopheles albimanus]|uniref:dynein assembly factor 1, axonemal homolog n=1 Tax=Anopheles albimanus TaxID=7167 RepID=UPI00163F09D5|nr:dynein assembly factor 1, axonemal homolog [Anopheles albimanus]
MVLEQLDNEFGPKKMTKKSIQASCRKNKLYLTPHLNDVLYLHYSGYNAIECLEEYVGLKCLWLECNAISSISGLEHQPQLRCLYLHNNLIKRIENLEHCKQLDTLNLSHNHITKIENCGTDVLPILNTLNLSHNYLKTVDSVAELRKCDFVSVLDISHNRIEDIAVVKILGDMKGLRVLTLTGNPVVNEIPAYRKTLILECKSLTYLDTRPVFEKDRACAEAWKRGGYEEERKEHLRWKREEQRKMRRNINATLRLRHRGDGEPELLKTSSDEEPGAVTEDGQSREERHFNESTECESNEVAWKEMEQLFSQHLEGPAKQINPPKAEPVTVPVHAMECLKKEESKRTALVEEITQEEYVNLITKKDPEAPHADGDNDIRTQDEQLAKHSKRNENAANVDEIESEMISSNEEMVDPSGDIIQPTKYVDIVQEEDKKLNENTPNDLAAQLDNNLESADCAKADISEDQNPLPKSMVKEKAEKIASAEADDTLNVTIQSREISITMQPSSLETNTQPPQPSTSIALEKTTTRKDSVVSAGNVTGSDSNSDPTLVTDFDRSVRNSFTCTSGSDTSDSEDMYDKIVPKKHRKLATTLRSEAMLCNSSSSSSSSDCDHGHGEGLNRKPIGDDDRQGTITEFIDEYKRFFHSVDVRDPRCVLKNRHKLVRPQTAKSQRTEPIVYEGVLRTIEQQSNETKIEQTRQEHTVERSSLAKEAVLDRLLKGHAEVDMDLEQQPISIGGKEHNFRDYRLEVFRKDQEKLQTLIDRVTAQKDKYNAHIDSIQDQLANIMDDYGQISEKLKRVDDMIQTIGEEITVQEQDRPTVECQARSIVEQIVENLTTTMEQRAEDGRQSVEGAAPDPASSKVSSDESNASSSGQDGERDEFANYHDARASTSRQHHRHRSLPVEFNRDPVYRKFIDIQFEIDKLTEDELFFALSDAARELQDEEKEEEEQAKMLHDAVDEYWSRYDDVDAFRQCLNLNAHPIIQRFRRFIEQCREEAESDADTADSTSADHEQHVRKLEQAYQRYERRLSNHLFDEYLIMSRKVSIATSATTGGESSATELELIEIEPSAGGGTRGLVAGLRASAWETCQELETDWPGKLEAEEEDQRPMDAVLTRDKPEETLDHLEDEESKPEQQVHDHDHDKHQD